MKLCPVCQTEIPLTAYKTRIYCSNKCRNHEMNSRVERTHAQKLSRESYHRCKSKDKNIIYFMLKNAKSRAMQKGYEFNLTEEDIILPTHCPILGVPLSKDGRRYGYSLDKKDPTKGYTSDNVWVISQLANAMKWDSTPEERKAFANWVLTEEIGV